MERYPRAAWHAAGAVLPGHQLLPVTDAITFNTGFAFGSSGSG
jgi:hypothetical protein